MQLKTYSAPTMAQALAEVKKDLGKDAVILHTRIHRIGAVMGIGGKQVVEITASDQAAARRTLSPQPVPVASIADSTRPARPNIVMEQFQPQVFPRRRLSPEGAISEEPPTPAQPEVVVRAADPAQVTPKAAASSRAPARPTRSLPATPVAPAPADTLGITQLRDELASIRRLMGEVLQASRGSAATVRLTDCMSDLSGRLAASGLDTAFVTKVMDVIRDELSSAEREDESVVRAAGVRALGALFPTVGHVTRPVAGSPLTIALVGPTGVGKTTTIAKLAAVYKLRQGRRVGLVTSDTYRIAAVDQLRTYASILGIPLRVALTPDELRASVAALSECDVILVDTAGRSPHDAARIAELSAFASAIQPHETHLVLSMAADASVLRRAVERFTSLRPDRLLLTKLDEAVELGAAMSVVAGLGLPVHYLTNGQEVPDHIELAQAERLAKLVLSPGTSTESASPTQAILQPFTHVCAPA